jgi:hypothetical protein
MFRIRILAIVLVLGCGSPGYAQVQPSNAPSSLEQDYASLCAGRSGPPSETCDTLRKALIGKLTSPSVPARVDTPSEEISKQTWGVFADAANRYWQNDDIAVVFAWIVPGRTLLMNGFWKRWNPGKYIHSYVLEPHPTKRGWLLASGAEAFELLPDGGRPAARTG